MLKFVCEQNKYNNRDTKQDEKHEEYQYKLRDIVNHGTMQKVRNGNVLTTFGSAMHFSLENNTIPILTTKRTAWKTCIKELLWFVQGKLIINH